MTEVQFRISSFLKDLIGRELITDEFVAVFELVKNSFDANAKTVKVIFEHQYDPENAKIIIWDDGYGMNLNDLNNKWLLLLILINEMALKIKIIGTRYNIGEFLLAQKGLVAFHAIGWVHTLTLLL